MFISDIHGSLYATRAAINVFKAESCDFLVILGDFLYHGPRNALPDEYQPSEVAVLLNSMKDKIIAVRGNCDAEIDEMVLNFPLPSSSEILVDGHRLFLTHGHWYNESHLPNLKKGDYLIHGHFHIPWWKNVDGINILSPGSISIPKGDSEPTYIIYDSGKFTFWTFDGDDITAKAKETI